MRIDDARPSAATAVTRRRRASAIAPKARSTRSRAAREARHARRGAPRRHPRRRLLGLLVRHRVRRRRAARARPRLRSRRERRHDGPRRRRPEEPHLPGRLGARLGEDADAPGLQVQEPATRRPAAAAVTRSPSEQRRRWPMDPFATLGLARALRPRPRGAREAHRELSRALAPGPLRRRGRERAPGGARARRST